MAGFGWLSKKHFDSETTPPQVQSAQKIKPVMLRKDSSSMMKKFDFEEIKDREKEPSLVKMTHKGINLVLPKIEKNQGSSILK